MSFSFSLNFIFYCVVLTISNICRTRSECSDYSFIDDEDSVIDVDFDLYTDADVEANLNTDLADGSFLGLIISSLAIFSITC